MCNIRVLEREVGLPKTGFEGEKKQRVLSCTYYDLASGSVRERDRIYVEMEQFFERNFSFAREDSYQQQIREIVYGRK